MNEKPKRPPTRPNEPISSDALLDAHRIGWTLVAARQLGLMPLLAVGATLEDLAREAQVEPGVLAPIVALLRDAGYAESGEALAGRWRLVDTECASKLVDALLALEARARTGLVERQALVSLHPSDLDVICQGIGGYGESDRAEIVRELADSAGLRSQFERGSHYLEIGAGHGLMTCSLLEGFPSLQATALERSTTAVRQLEAFAREIGVDGRLSIKNVDATLDWPDRTFDIIYWSQAFFAPEERLTVIRWLVSVLQADGIVLVFPYAEFRPDARPEERRARLFDLAAHAGWGCPLLDAAELILLMESHGLDLRACARVWSDETLLIFHRRGST